MSRAREESGWAVLTTVLVISILLALALPLMSIVDTQQQGSAQERRSESSFNLAEAALNATVFTLSNEWPADDSAEYPPSCGESSSGDGCPDADALARTYEGADYSDRAWTVTVRDDTGSEVYEAGEVAVRPRWDENDNGKLWVRADGRAEGRRRSIATLVRMQEQVENFPRNVLTAGRFRVSNGGNKVIVDTLGDAGEAAPLRVRCLDEAPSACLDYDPSRDQVSPETSEPDFVGSALSAAGLERLRLTAKARGTYYASGCPSSPAGKLVFIESGDCVYGGSGAANSEAAPGAIVVARGTISFAGNSRFYGLIYAANLQGSSGDVVSLGGSSEVVGAIAVDGDGAIVAGASGRNLKYSEQIWPDFTSYGTVGVVQGTWRELPAS